MTRCLRAARAIILPCALGVLAVLAACGDDDDTGGNSATVGNSATPDSEPNVFQNGGFEGGREPWFALKPPDWILSNNRAHSGEYGAYLEMRDTAADEETKIHYLVQEVEVSELPQILSGNYFVENWVKGTKNQYLQFVVILFGDNFDGLPLCPAQAPGTAAPCPNYQIRYLLAGIQEDPFAIANAKFIYISQDQPAQGEWVSFSRDLHQDFQEAWGTVPANLTKIRVLFEVRYDGKLPTEGPLEADVYYDDLYMGPPPSQ